MLNNELKYLWQMLLLCIFQAAVFNHFHLLGYATPIITPLMLLYLPINAGRSATMFRAFLLGVAIDMLSGTPGQTSAAMVATAMLRPSVLRLYMPREHADDMIPSYRTMGRKKHIYLMFTLLIPHHIIYFALEAMSYITHTALLISLGTSIALSFVVMMAVDSLRDRKPLTKE